MPKLPQLSSLILAVLCVHFTACSSKREPSLHTTNAYQMRTINGDPMVFVKGSTMNGNAVLPSNILTNPGLGWNMHVSGFIQEKLEPIDVDDVVQEETPQSEVDAIQTIRDSVASTWDFYDTDKGIVLASPQDLYFTFERKDDDSLQLKMMTLYPYEMDVGSLFDVLHVSATPDGNAFSILVHSKEVFDAEAVFSFTFVRVTSKDLTAIERVEKVFEYLFGAGIKVNWDNKQKLVVSVCGDSPKELKQLVPEMVATWQSALHGKLELGIDFPEACPPFSDLNSHSYWYISDWVEILGEPAVAGQTLSIPNFTTGKLIDSDIVIFLGEFQEALDIHQTNIKVSDPSFYQNQSMQSDLYQTGLHEMGHFLGLHHKFDDEFPSIMSYSDKRESSLTAYDKNAIQTLYAEPKPETLEASETEVSESTDSQTETSETQISESTDSETNSEAIN